MDRHHKGAPRVQKQHFPEETPGQLRKRETHNRYFHLRNQGPRVEKGRAGIAWVRPGAALQTRAGVPAASTRRCMRETRAAPPAALSLVTVWTRLWGSRDPQRQAVSHGPGTAAGARGRGGGTAELQPPRPGARGRVESAALPVRSGAPSANRLPTLPGSLLAGADLPCCRPGSERSVLPRGAFLLGPERAVQRRLRVSRPRAGSATRSRPRPQSRARARAHPAESAQPAAPRSPAAGGAPGGRSRPSAPVTAAGASCPSSYRQVRGSCARRPVRRRRAALDAPALSCGLRLRSRRGKVCAPGRPRGPACLHRPP